MDAMTAALLVMDSPLLNASNDGVLDLTNASRVQNSPVHGTGDPEHLEAMASYEAQPSHHRETEELQP